MIIICAVLYGVLLFILKGAQKPTHVTPWRAPSFLPHGAMIRGDSLAIPITIVWFLALILSAATLRFMDEDTAVVVEYSVVTIEMIVIASGIACVQEAGIHHEKENTKSDEKGLVRFLKKRFPYVMLVGSPREIIELKGNAGMEHVLVDTPYDGVVLAPSESIEDALVICPTIRTLPWTEEAHKVILEPHAITLEKLDEKIASAMELESALEEERVQKDGLLTALKEAEAANRTLDRALQDIRLRGTGNIDYIRMTPTQRAEERRGLEEALRRLESADLSGDISLQPPEEGFQSEVRLGS